MDISHLTSIINLKKNALIPLVVKNKSVMAIPPPPHPSPPPPDRAPMAPFPQTKDRLWQNGQFPEHNSTQFPHYNSISNRVTENSTNFQPNDIPPLPLINPPRRQSVKRISIGSSFLKQHLFWLWVWFSISKQTYTEQCQLISFMSQGKTGNGKSWNQRTWQILRPG